MTPAGYSLLAAAVLIGAAAISAANARSRTASAAMQSPGGIYAVDIVTRYGSCGRDYHLMISISGGRISLAGGTPLEATGQIDKHGVVALVFERFGQVATVTGKLARGAGSGTWASPSLQCAGSWRATRQS